MYKFFFVVCIVFCFMAGAEAQTKLLRFPDIHGDKVVFCYGGDIWKASTAGGTAVRLTAHAGRDRVAGILLFAHGRTATYALAWTGAEGRRLRAHNLLLWRAVLELRERGLGWLDLGGVNAAAAPGVARFKLGLGGRLHTLAGTFI